MSAFHPGAMATAEHWPYDGYPRRCRVVSRRRTVCGPPGLAVAPGRYVLAGPLPLCRPASAYRLTGVGPEVVTATVVHSPGSRLPEGTAVSWPRAQFEAAWRLGDVRLVPAWSAPVETLVESLERRTGRATKARATRPTLVAATN